MSPHPSSPDASSTSIVASGVAIARPAATETASKRKKRVCGNCAGTRSSVWRPAFPPAEGVLCNRCHGRAVQAAHAAEEDEEEASEEGQAVEEEMAEDVDVLDLGGVRASRRRGSMPVAEKKEDGKKGRRKSAFAVLKATGKKEKGGKRSKGKIAELTEGEDVNEEAHTKEEQVETEDMAEAGIKESPRSRASPRRTKAADDPVTVSPNKEKTMDETPTAKRVKLNDGAASESGTVSPKKDAEQAKDVEEKDEKMDDLFHKPAFEAETISANKSPARTTVEPVLTPSASNELIAICAEKTEEKTEFVCIKVATDKSNLTKYTK
ncbi:hypothetical protein BC830DRAFT_938268 [Chytriomyces sp. MP71]|nr:hypothetical protein BC830DRAFT_938268 [Chytriomyces sp. MP71]